MKFVDEYRDKGLIKKLASQIARIACGKVNLMEVCGTHTVAIFKSGIRQLLPKNINIVSGPGCPVCVTSQADIDCMISLAKQKDIIIASFGDMLRVPGSENTLEQQSADGSDIRLVYSPQDALEIAGAKRNREVVFLAVGFETTSPAVASVIEDARHYRINNFSVYCSHKIIPPAIEALLGAGEVKLNGLVLPGHVSAIIGSKAYDFIPEDFNTPCVISGFEPVDILESILMLLKQMANGTSAVEIQYRRAVRQQGNLLAQRLLKRVFEVTDAKWRGLGVIKNSGYKLNKKYREFDAKERFRIKEPESKGPRICSCGEILRGVKNPAQCKLFAKKCTPLEPFGPCMVSTEGTCAAWYKYGSYKDEKR